MMDAKRIIVVEDESIVALDIKLQLEGLGYQVPHVYDTGEALLANIESVKPDLVLLDIILKGELDGIETAEQVKQRVSVPIILLTALDTREILERAKLAQPFAFIVKPFDEIQLRNSVAVSLYRHEMERALWQREKLFSTTLSSIQDAVFVTDQDYRIDYTNVVGEALVGATYAELSGRDARDELRFADADGNSCNLLSAMTGPLTMASRDGMARIVERSVSPLVGEDGDATGWVITVHDVTERAQQEERFRRAQKMEAIGRLTGGIAHDFNNLLTVILGYSKLLAEDLREGAEEADRTDARLADVEGIQKAAMRSAALTRQLLAFSRHQIMERRVVDVNTIVADMQKMIERLVSDDVRTQVDLLAAPATVRVDPSQLEQVLMNLAVNARDAMPNGGRFAIRTEVQSLHERELAGREGVRPGDFVSIVVRDTGSGMSDEVVEKIFDPFFTTKPTGKGTGLGLSTVYGIVSQSGGFVDLKTAVGKGTTFTVYLPLHTGRASEITEPQALEEVRSGTETILLVEDDDSIRELLARVLRRKGYTVHEGANAGEALLIEERTGETIDLLVTDVVMPHLSGSSLAARIVRKRPRVKVLYLSAYPQGYLSDEDRTIMGTHFMQKPVEPARLVERIRAILDE